MLLALVFLDQNMKATLTQIIQWMSCKPDGKLKKEKSTFVEEKTISSFIHILLGLSVTRLVPCNCPNWWRICYYECGSFVLTANSIPYARTM